jgi:hypothetical protein
MQTWTVAKARNSFTELYHAVTNEWEEILVEHGSRKKAQKMSLVTTEFLDALVNRNYQFVVEWTYTQDDTAPDGWWTVWSPQFRLYGDGPAKEEALRSLAKAVIEEVSLAMQDVRAYFGSREQMFERFPYFRRIARLIEENGVADLDKVVATLGENMNE